MQSKRHRLSLAVALATAGLTAGGPAIAEPVHLVPQAIQIAHKESLEQLTQLTHRKGAVGVAAKKVLVLIKRHVARENEFIMPPLTLLPLLAEGKVTPDMAWALPMTERVRAEHEQIFKEHMEITDGLNELATAAAKAHDNDAKEFAEATAADSLTDLEIMEPTLLLIGDTLRAKLPAAH